MAALLDPLHAQSPHHGPKEHTGAGGQLVRSTFTQPTSKEVWAQHERISDELKRRFSATARRLREASEDVLAFTTFPQSVWHQIWSNSPQERLNREIQRRSDVVGIFPNRKTVTRLIGSVLGEYNYEWMATRRYMSVAAPQDAQATANGDTSAAELETEEESVLVEQLAA